MRQSPRFWVLHFTASAKIKSELNFLRLNRDAHWRLTFGQAAVFKDIFLKLFFEHSRPSRWGAAVEEAWLRLLLAEVQRWIETSGQLSEPSPPSVANPDLLRLWQLVNECVPQPGQLMRRLRADVPNYDSLRHSFRSVFGCSPKQLLLNLRDAAGQKPASGNAAPDQGSGGASGLSATGRIHTHVPAAHRGQPHRVARATAPWGKAVKAVLLKFRLPKVFPASPKTKLRTLWHRIPLTRSKRTMALGPCPSGSDSYL